MRALASAFEQLELAAGSLARAVQRRPTLGFLVLLPLFGSGRRPAQTLSSRLSLPTACTFVPPSPLPSDTAVSLEPGARALLQGGSVEPTPAIWSSAALGFSITSPTSRPTWAVFWPRPVHINLLETACIYRLLCLPARRGDLAKCFSVLCDSNVARCSVQKGRSPSAALARGLKRIAAVAFTFGFFAQVPFCPTRLMPADHPSRDAPIPEPIESFLDPSWSPAELRALAALPKMRRWIASWLRLFLLVSAFRPPPLPLIPFIFGRFCRSGRIEPWPHSEGCAYSGSGR